MFRLLAPTQKQRKQWSRKWGRKQGEEYANKTLCTSAVLEAFGIERHQYRYAQCLADARRILKKNGWRVVTWVARPNLRMSEVSKRVREGYYGKGTFIIRVPQHVLLMDGEGDVFVDTDPRKRDRRRVTHVLTVSKPTS